MQTAEQHGYLKQLNRWRKVDMQMYRFFTASKLYSARGNQLTRGINRSMKTQLSSTLHVLILVNKEALFSLVLAQIDRIDFKGRTKIVF